MIQDHLPLWRSLPTAPAPPTISSYSTLLQMNEEHRRLHDLSP